jgi:hypothetical protein
VVQVHPVLAGMAVIDAALKDLADVDPTFMSTGDKRDALLGLGGLVDRLEELRLRVLAVADDVAAEEAARDAAAWVAHHGRLDRGEQRRRLRLATALDRRAPGVARSVREGEVNLAQAEVVVRALEALPAGLDPEIRARAEAALVAQAAEFGPRQLRVLGRRVLDVVAPEVAEGQELRQLQREEAAAARRTFLHTRSNGDGTTDLHARVGDPVADRLLTYLDAYTSPRREGSTAPDDRRPYDQRPYDQRLGHAFAAFLEAIDPARLPIHGGDATTVLVTIDLATLRGDLDAVGVGFLGDEPITADQARRLACNATLIPAVLGGHSQPLDIGRADRFFKPWQRKAKQLTTPTCEAEGCDIPAPWCEAHHGRQPWSRGGRTDLDDLVLLCGFHHHRAHDPHYDLRRRPGAGLTFHRRT